ncbi:hypothetical protein BGX33_009041 [Mortierella sp. NVP41]|nr:hypothetical protein BGX33_009041 [Mortierella sp. NVP41]
MENASATRLRFKGSATSSSKKRKHSDKQHSYLDTTPSSPSRSSRRSWSRSRSRSPRRSSSKYRRARHKSRAHSRSRSRSPAHRSQSQSQSQSKRSRSSKYKVTPAGYAPDSIDSYCFDDGELEAAYLRKLEQDQRAYDMEQQQAEEAGDPWLSHLFDELANDDPFEYHSSRFSTQRATGSRKHDKIQSLSDDAYTSYMRKGMGRSRSQREAQEWEEWVEEQERIKYKDARREQKRKDEERSRRRQERRERERLEEETEAAARVGIGSHQTIEDSPANRLRKRALVDQARRVYEQGWRALIFVEDCQGTTTTTQTLPLPLLTMDTIPWPPLSGTSESSADGSSAGSLSLFDFLFFGTTADQMDVRKQLLRREQLKFHPDKFKQRFGVRLPQATATTSAAGAAVGTVPGERERILEQVEKVARALNELGEMF